jgi:pSer/pThr/pTyr-binding forkhead associated (FHA) protein
MRLVIEDEAGTRSSVPLADDAIVVGRAVEGVTLRLPDRDVSRRHARFFLQGGSAFVEDLGSLTGTHVNGERIDGRRRLRDGDLVRIGDYDLAVLAADVADAGADAPPPLPAPARDPSTVTGPIAPVPVPATPPAREAARPRGRPVRRAVAAGAVALVLGLAAGYAVGVLTGPAPSQVTRP